MSTTPAANQRPEIKTAEAAQLVGGMVTDLYAKWLSASQEVERLQGEAKASAAAMAEQVKSLRQEIRERDLKIDDLSQREFSLQEKLDLERIEGEAMRGELRHLNSTIAAANARVEGAVMRDVEDRQERRNNRGSAAIDVAAIEEALLRAAENVNANAVEPQPQRLDARPVRQTVLPPEDEIDR